MTELAAYSAQGFWRNIPPFPLVRDVTKGKGVKELMTVRQVAEAIHYSPRRVRELIKQGKIKAHRLMPGGQWRIDPSSVSLLAEFETQRQHSAEYFQSRALAAMARVGLKLPDAPARL